MTARIGIQLYTVREQCDSDLEGTLDTIAELGYDGVELYSLHGREPHELRRTLDQRGLAIAGRHAGLEALEMRLDDLAAEQRALGCERIALSWVDPPESAADADAAARRIEAIAARATAAGLRFGFHNHWGELATLDDGSTLLARLTAVPRELLWLELDLGWAWDAGAEPADLLERLRDRTPLVHVKDLRGRGTREHVPVGEGAVGYATIVPRAVELGVEWLIVEQDELDREPAEALAVSLAAVRTAIGVAA
jgi:sugar phosphate isomerase/epimerase